MTNALEPSFFARPALVVARELLGMLLISRLGRVRTGGRIVETEAYLAEHDAASHARRGPTPSNAAMFGPAGCAYVYPIHAGHCFNVVTGQPGEPTAVLVRALEPLWGLPTMRRRRNQEPLTRLTTGPSCLCQALGIDRRHDHLELWRGQRLWIEPAEDPIPATGLCQTPRIGVTSATELPYRFAVADHPCVSGPRRWRQSNPPTPG